jgi:hypothetical protein
MITRLMLSLKKAADSQEHAWTLGEPTTVIPMRFAERQDVIMMHDMSPNTSASTDERTQIEG